MIKTVDLPPTIPQSGEVIYLNAPVNAQGFLIFAWPLRNDATGFAFEMAEFHAGNSQLKSKTLDYDTFACDVFADSPKRALTNDNDNLAYDFNVTKLGESNYVAASIPRDTTRFQEAPIPRPHGYASSPDALFGTRTGANAGDHIVTRTENHSKHMRPAASVPRVKAGIPS